MPMSIDELLEGGLSAKRSKRVSANKCTMSFQQERRLQYLGKEFLSTATQGSSFAMASKHPFATADPSAKELCHMP
jgi:hypothetical protein